MKKKILALCLVVALLATAIAGATLAYFTDTDTETNEFTVGNVKIDLKETFDEETAILVPGSKTENAIEKIAWVENVGAQDAYMWIEVWVPSALDDGDDHSPAAPGLGNNLHFNYNSAVVTETKATFLGEKDGYNGYVHYVKGSDPIAKGGKTPALLDQVYMDAKCTQCTNKDHNDCMVLMDGTHYADNWDLVINAVGFQADGFTIEEAITEYYGKDVTAHIW